MTDKVFCLKREGGKGGASVIDNRRMPFTQDQMSRAYQTDLVDYVKEMGLELINHGPSNLKAKGHGGLVFLKNGRGFNWFSRDVGGNVVDFVKEWHEVDFIRAVEILINTRAYDHDIDFQPYVPLPKKKLVLPDSDNNKRMVYAYLSKTRGLEHEVIQAMIDEKKIYQTKVERNGKTFRNCAFVGYGMNNIPKYCSLRALMTNSSFRQEVTGSQKSHGFRMEGTRHRLFAFEAPIDAMSHASLSYLNGFNWREDHRVCGGGLSDKAIKNYLREHEEIKEIIFCFDNDKDGTYDDGKPRNHGQEQAYKYFDYYQKLGYSTLVQKPRTKDFNGDLLMYRQLCFEESRRENQEYEYSEQEDGEWER